jgi:methylenetetrahydrofolate reductase (NADPH)
MSSETYFKPEKGGHAYASELVEQINSMNQGIYLDSGLESPGATDFCIGVAGYPKNTWRPHH